VYGDGQQSRDFIHVRDVVAAFLAVAERSHHCVYNVGTGADTSIQGLLATVEKIAGRPLQRNELPAWPNDIRSIRADVRRIQREFGFKPKVSLAAGLADTINYFSSLSNQAR
jgi:UDP-glucose 4-epimerase